MKNIFIKKISFAVLAAVFALIPASFALAAAPTMTNTPATGITSSIARLNGTFASNGLATQIRFEYGDTPLMLQTTAYQSKSATDSGAFSAQISVLPGKTYFYRAVGINAGGPAWAAPTETFTTPHAPISTLPTVMTSLQTGVSQTSATLNGFFHGNGSTTTTYFEYGTSASLGSTTASVLQSNNFGTFADTISVQPGTTYYFRAVATTSAGTKQGSILNFLVPGSSNQTYQCNDGIDNDSDGLVDYPQDPGCVALTDNTEYSTPNPVVYQCNDGIDNDGNGLTDYPADPGCSSLSDTTESGYNNQQNNTGIPNTATYSATNITQTSATLTGYVDPQGAYTTYWFQYGTSPNNMSATTATTIQWFTAGNVSTTLNYLQPNTTYYFRLIAQNSNGTNYNASIQSFTTGTNGWVAPSGSAPKAITTIETGIGSTTATLHGVITNASVPTTTWFEYGQTNAFGNTTSTQIVGSGSQLDFQKTISGLTPNTIYYWRAVAQNQYGISYGGTLIFQTKGQGSAGTGGSPAATSASYVTLKIQNTYKDLSVGDTANFAVTYKNTSNRTFKDAIIRIDLPAELTFERASQGKYSKAGNRVTVIIGGIAPGQEGTISIQAKARGGNDSIATTGVLAYTQVNTGTQYETVAYSIDRISGSSDSTLAGASLFGSGAFLPDTLVEWLLLIAVIFGLVFFGRKLTEKKA